MLKRGHVHTDPNLLTCLVCHKFVTNVTFDLVSRDGRLLLGGLATMI